MDIKKYIKQIKQIKDLVPGEMTFGEQTLVLSTLEMVLNLVGELQEEVRELKDEINRLKGEDGRPNISGRNSKEKDEEKKKNSSEKERKEKKKKKKRIAKFDSSQRIDQRIKLDIPNKSSLPQDIEFKGYATSYYQDLEIVSKLIEIKRAIYYSPTKNKTYTASLPKEYKIGHDYTQKMKGHIIMLKFEFGMTIPKIGDFLRMSGIAISNSTISNILLDNGEFLKEESLSIHRNGIEVGSYVQTDTTGARVNGENYHSHIFCNAYFTSYFTTAQKDRQTTLDLLRCGQQRIYVLNELAFSTYDYLKIPKKVQRRLHLISFEGQRDKKYFLSQVRLALSPEDFERHKDKLLEGAYLAAYLSDNPVNILVCDDAPQYKLLGCLIALCWIHAGRHFKKLNPTLTHHRKLLESLLNDFWNYYHKLKAYQKEPNPIIAKQLSAEFDKIFSRKTGYEQLDERLKKTKAKKDELLVVLKNPFVPLHNNDSELAARKEVRYRDISFQTKNIKGTQAKDVFFTIIQTCKKLGVNAYAYILDKLTCAKRMMPLDELILLRARENYLNPLE